MGLNIPRSPSSGHDGKHKATSDGERPVSDTPQTVVNRHIKVASVKTS